MQSSDDNTSELLNRATGGSSGATEQLMQLHRVRLRRMVQSRLDPRLGTRLDPSDVVQDVLLTAAGRLPDFAQSRELPFYVWLRQIAWDRLSELYRMHVRVEKRTVTREVELSQMVSDDSVDLLAVKLPSREPSPHEGLLRTERRLRLRHALESLPGVDRELPLMRYVEQMKLGEIAAQLSLSLAATKSRHLRALDKLATLLDDSSDDRLTSTGVSS